MDKTTPNFPAPPGTTKLAHNVFVDKKPVSYLDYFEFYYFIKTNHAHRLSEITPSDTSLMYNNDVLWNNPKFYDFPVLGLNKAQIAMYCKWRSHAVNGLIEQIGLRCSKDKYWSKVDRLDPDKRFKVVYSHASFEKLKNQDKVLKNNSFDECLMDGIWNNPVRRNAKRLSNENQFAFRCAAEYRLKSIGALEGDHFH